MRKCCVYSWFLVFRGSCRTFSTRRKGLREHFWRIFLYEAKNPSILDSFFFCRRPVHRLGTRRGLAFEIMRPPLDSRARNEECELMLKLLFGRSQLYGGWRTNIWGLVTIRRLPMRLHFSSTATHTLCSTVVSKACAQQSSTRATFDLRVID